MTCTTLGAPPSDIGDLIELVWTITPPEHEPDAIVSAVTVLIRKPNGTEVAGVAEQLDPNVWLCSAPARCDIAGPWLIRMNANAGLVLSREEKVTIAPSGFTTPLP